VAASPWYRSFQKALRWGSYIAAHGLVTILLIAVIHGIQWLVILAGDPKLFDVIPLRYILDGMDLGLLLVFVVLGTTEAVRVFREPK
jgi:hypothetical protein